MLDSFVNGFVNVIDKRSATNPTQEKPVQSQPMPPSLIYSSAPSSYLHPEYGFIVLGGFDCVTFVCRSIGITKSINRSA